MERGDRGVWSVTVAGDLAGEFYHYAVTNNNRTRNTLDPYARSMAGFNSRGGAMVDRAGKAAIIDLEATKPEGWRRNNHVQIDDPVDAIIYEMSVRDFYN